MDEEILKFFKWNELMDFFFKVEIDVLVLSMFFFNTNFCDPFNLIMCVCVFILHSQSVSNFYFWPHLR